jgi:2-methylcitrate dehydratase PrpD
MTTAEALASYCASLATESLPETVTETARSLLLDALGGALRAHNVSSSVVTERALESLAPGGNGGCTVWATGERRAAEHATLLNGTHVHTLEVDDTHREAVVHPGSVIFPTALAVAERRDADGKTFLRGVVAGYEVAIRLGLGLPTHRVHSSWGFHGTPTCGVFGATAAGAVVRGLDEARIRNAFGVNVSQASGTLQWASNGGWNKRIHPGLAAREALVSVELAANEFHAASKPIEGGFGFLNAYGDDPEFAAVGDGLGESYAIRDVGVKPYACCRYNHTPINVTLEVVRDHDVDPDEVRHITLTAPEPVVELSRPIERKTAPESVVDAQFSPQYAVAVAIADRAALVDQYDERRLDDPELRALMDVVTVEEDPAMTERHPRAWPAGVRIETDRGTFERSRELPLGESEDSFGFPEVEEKFRRLTEPVLSTARQDAVAEAVRAIDRTDGPAALLAELRTK